MAIIARRIPSGLDGVRRGGLGDASSCGPNQQWDPNYVFNGIKGQCTPKGSPMTPASSSPSFFESFMSAMFPKPATPAAAATPQVVIQQAPGMSTNTKIALGVGAVGLVALILIATRK